MSDINIQGKVTWTLDSFNHYMTQTLTIISDTLRWTTQSKPLSSASFQSSICCHPNAHHPHRASPMGFPPVTMKWCGCYRNNTFDSSNRHRSGPPDPPCHQPLEPCASNVTRNCAHPEASAWRPLQRELMLPFSLLFARVRRLKNTNKSHDLQVAS